VARARVADVAFAGKSVAYERISDQANGAETSVYTQTLVRQRPGGPPRKLVELGYSLDSDLDENSNDAFDWDVSGSSLLLGRHTTIYRPAGPDDYQRTIGGPLAGPFHRLADCEGGGVLEPTVAVWRNFGAYYDPCSDTERIVVGRLDAPREPATHLPLENVGRIDLAGDYVASATPYNLEVLDRRDGRRLYASETRLYGGGSQYYAGAIDLQPDGKLGALLVKRDGDCRVAWFSPAEPRPHVVGRAACFPGGLQMRSDYIAYARPRALVVSDLAGHTRTIARFRGRSDRTTGPGAFAFDGRRLAYGVARCDARRTLLLRASLDGPVWPDRDPLVCPLRVLRRTGFASARRRVARVPVRCPRGCSGTVRVSDTGQYHDFSVTPDGKRMRVPLDARTVRELKRRGSASLAFALSARDRDGRSSDERLVAVALRARR
jgi:hypothetical protein